MLGIKQWLLAKWQDSERSKEACEVTAVWV